MKPADQDLNFFINKIHSYWMYLQHWTSEIHIWCTPKLYKVCALKMCMFKMLSTVCRVKNLNIKNLWTIFCTYFWSVSGISSSEYEPFFRLSRRGISGECGLTFPLPFCALWELLPLSLRRVENRLTNEELLLKDRSLKYVIFNNMTMWTLY